MAFANLLDSDVQEVFDFIGHDGSEIIWPLLPEPLCRRSFHIQEILVWAHRTHNAHFIGIERIPVLGVDDDHIIAIDTMDLDDYLSNYSGVLCGTLNGNRHAATWHGNMIFDSSSGLKYDLYAMEIEIAHFLI